MFTALRAVVRNLPTAAKVVGGAALAVGAAYGAKKLYSRLTDGPKGSTTSRRKPKAKKKASPAKKKKLKAVKTAASRLRKHPSAANVKKAVAAAHTAGIALPPAVTAAADKL